MFRYRYMETINRKLSWENTPGSGSGGSDSSSPKDALKAAMAQAARKHGDRSAAKPSGAKSSSEASGFSPGRKNGDGVRDAVDHLFGADKTAPYEYDLWKSPLKNIRNYLGAERSPKEPTAEDVLHATTAEGDGSVIDPITNRKVPQSASKYKDLNKYEKTKLDDPDASKKPTPEEESKKYTDLGQYKPVHWNEPDGLQKPTAEEDSKRYKDLDKYSSAKIDNANEERILTPEERSKFYDDLDKYGAVRWNEPDGLVKKTPEEKTKEYDDLEKYGPVRWNEPDGLQKPTAEEKSKAYDDLDSYGAVRWNEPDGLVKPTPEELSKNYDDLDKYGAVRWNEPDGLRKLTPEEESKKYEDLETYGEPFTAKDSAIEAHEASQMDTTQRGETLPPKVIIPPRTKLTPEELSKNYDDLHKYGPVRWNEPDGLQKLTPEELSKNYDDLHKYGPVKWNEPDGLQVLTPEELSKLYADLKAYSPPETTRDAPNRVHPEEASKNYKDLDKYDPKQFDEVDQTYPIHPEEATKAYKDLGKYEPSEFDEVDRTYPTHPEELTKRYKDLNRYEPKKFDAADQSYPIHPEEATKTYADLGSYNSVLRNEPDGKPATASGLFSRGTKAAPSGKPPGKRNRFFSDFSETPIDVVDSLTAQEIRAEVLRKAKDNSKKSRMEQSKAEHDESWDASTKAAQEAVQKSKESGHKMTGSYTRDFPEEFSRSWSTANSPSKSTLYPNDIAEAAQARDNEVPAQSAEEEVEVSSMDESFPKEDARLEPALNRGATRRASRKATKSAEDETQKPETTFFEAKDANFGPVISKHYPAKESKQETASAAPSEAVNSDSASADEPALYKILAYDPTMQTIDIAETSSVVPDTAAPLTPADVLLRLSNPSKFFPHFEPLQAEGYEIVSGSGDVLVFRKVRAAGLAPKKASSAQLGASSVNPVDMMGKPVVTGNFASPTGFVNYDEVSEDPASKPEPPFRSNIDVRREEAVFSGPRPGRNKDRKKKRSLGRKMVMGTVWVAGTAYAVGVLGEYFSTGGMSATGPQGL